MDLKQLLKADFEIDFPISGGMGNSRDNPIVIHRKIPNDYTSVEYGSYLQHTTNLYRGELITID